MKTNMDTTNTASRITGTENCKALTSQLPALLPDLLLDPAALPAATAAHIASCDGCQAAIDRELAPHRATLHLLNHWGAPEVSPYFDSRMTALLREEQQRAPAGILERVRGWFLLTNMHMKPMAGAAALGLLLAIGGGTWLDLTMTQPVPAPQASATVRDLQSLDDNAQVFQQLSSLDTGDEESGSTL